MCIDRRQGDKAMAKKRQHTTGQSISSFLRDGRVHWILLTAGFLIILLVSYQQGMDLITGEEETETSVLRIHSPLNERIIIPILKEFQETTGIQAEYLSAGTLDILGVLDEKGDDYVTDVVWGGSEEYLSIYEDQFDRFTGSIDLASKGIEADREDFLLGYNLLPIVLIYNTKLVADDQVPVSLQEVLDPKWRGKLAFADPKASGSAFIALSFLLEMDGRGTRDWDRVTRFLENLDGKLLAKSSEVYEGVAEGDFSIGITMEEAAINLMHRGEDVNFVYFAEGTPVITDSIAIMKDARHREEALAFVDFVLSRKVQSYMVERFYLRSIRQDVDVPLGLVPMDQINIFSASDLTTYDEKERILNRWIQLEREAGIE